MKWTGPAVKSGAQHSRDSVESGDTLSTMMPTWHLTSLWVHGVWHMSFEPSWCPHNDMLCQKFWKNPFLEQSSLKGHFFEIFQNLVFVIAPLFLILNQRRFVHCVPKIILKILDEKKILKVQNCEEDDIFSKFLTSKF